MVMEAFEGFETRVRYDIVGHSGESRNIPFVNEKKPPADSNARLETIKVRLDFCLKLNFFSKYFFGFRLFFADDACTLTILLVW